MRVLTVGDSFTYGEELSDLNNAWPFLLGNRLGYEVTNLAKPGSGNTRMVRTVVEQAADYDLIIVAWSHYARIEFADEYGIYDTWPGHRGRMFVGDLSFRTELMDYINHYHSDDYLYKQYLLNIILLQSYTQRINKKLIVLDSFGNAIKRTLYNLLTSQIDTQYFVGWPNESMMNWTYPTPHGPGGHFLEEGHAKVADKIYEHIRSLGWI